jgi:chromosome segregation ATPase
MHKKPYAFESRIEKVTDPVELLHKSQKQIKQEIAQAENQLKTNQQQTNLISQKLEQEVSKVSNLNSEVKNLLAQNAKLRKNVQKTNNDNKAKKSNVVDFIQKYEAKIQNLDEQLVKDHQEIEEKKTQEARLSNVLTKFLGEFEGLRDMVKTFKKEMSAMTKNQSSLGAEVKTIYEICGKNLEKCIDRPEKAVTDPVKAIVVKAAKDAAATPEIDADQEIKHLNATEPEDKAVKDIDAAINGTGAEHSSQSNIPYEEDIQKNAPAKIHQHLRKPNAPRATEAVKVANNWAKRRQR